MQVFLDGAHFVKLSLAVFFGSNGSGDKDLLRLDVRLQKKFSILLCFFICLSTPFVLAFNWPSVPLGLAATSVPVPTVSFTVNRNKEVVNIKKLLKTKSNQHFISR